MKRLCLFCVIVVALLGLASPSVNAQLPPDFPGLTVTTYNTNAVGEGYIFLEVTDSSTNGGYYVMILENNGSPVWYQNVTNHNYDFKVLPNGYLHYADFYHTHSWTGGGDCTHEILDDSYNPEETITAGNGYVADAHDFQLLPNGHVLLDGYYLTQMDVSKYVAGGYPNALRRRRDYSGARRRPKRRLPVAVVGSFHDSHLFPPCRLYEQRGEEPGH